MRATQVIARGRAEFITLPEPPLTPGHILVRTLYVALCGSDVHRLYYARDEQYPFPPGTSGHEVIGRVEAVAAPESGIRVGDLALVLSPVENAMCEWFVAAAEDVIVLPPSEHSLPEMLMGQQLGTAVFAAKYLPNLVGQDVAIIGQGSAGLFLDHMCRRLGARHVIGLDLHAARLAVAAHFGATHAVDNSRQDGLQAVREITGGRLCDVVIEAAGDIDAIRLAPQLVRQFGRLHFFGVPRGSRFEFDFETFYRKYCLTQCLAGAGNEPGRTSIRQALDMIASGDIDVRPAITHHLPFERVLEGYEMAYTGADGCIKIVIDMPA
jgi:NADPH:quinone reductase